MLAPSFLKMVLVGSFLTASTGISMGKILFTSKGSKVKEDQKSEVLQESSIIKDENSEKVFQNQTESEVSTSAEKKCRIYKIENRSTGQVSRIDISKIKANDGVLEKINKVCDQHNEVDVFVEYKYEIRWDFWNSGGSWTYHEEDQRNSIFKSYLDSNPDLRK